MNNLALKSAADFYVALKERIEREISDLDEETLLDTLEGETDVANQIAKVLRSAREDQAYVEGLKIYRDQIISRIHRLEENAEKKRKIAFEAMDETGIRKIMVPDMTIYIRTVPPAVVVTDETLIPDKYMIITKRPDKLSIKAALKDGIDVPGCLLSNPSETVAIKGT